MGLALIDQAKRIDKVEGLDDSVSALGQRRYAGRVHIGGQAVFAKTVAEDIADNRRLAGTIAREECPWDA
jgi:hypothetical protein